MTAKEFWDAAVTFRHTDDVEARHRARISLMLMAVGNDERFIGRAADALLSEGMVIGLITPENVVRA